MSTDHSELRASIAALKESRPLRGSDPTAKCLLTIGEVDSLLDEIDRLKAEVRDLSEDQQSLGANYDEACDKSELSASIAYLERTRAERAEADRERLVSALREVLRTGINGGNNVRLAYIAVGGKALSQDLLDQAKASERAVVFARSALASIAPNSSRTDGQTEGDLCDDCPPAGYPTDKTRCLPCPRREASPDSTAKEPADG